MVRAKGLEPPHLAILEPKSSASTNSATPARTLEGARPITGVARLGNPHQPGNSHPRGGVPLKRSPTDATTSAEPRRASPSPATPQPTQPGQPTHAPPEEPGQARTSTCPRRLRRGPAVANADLASRLESRLARRAVRCAWRRLGSGNGRRRSPAATGKADLARKRRHDVDGLGRALDRRAGGIPAARTGSAPAGHNPRRCRASRRSGWCRRSASRRFLRTTKKSPERPRIIARASALDQGPVSGGAGRERRRGDLRAR